MKQVYVSMGVDILHNGHINILKEAQKLGEVTVGLLTDEVIATYKRFPLLNYEQRKEIMSNMVGVRQVIKQDTLDYTHNLVKLRPDYVVHGTDWIEGPLKDIRKKVIETLAAWNGQLIEIPYTEGVSISLLEEKLNQIGTTSFARRAKLRKLIEMKPIVRILEAHDGLSGLIVEKTMISTETGMKSFDGMWSSSLCDSTIKGKPDIELVDITSRLNTINEILDVTTKPMIYDGDTGGKIEHFVYTVKTLERLGISAVIIEDKIGLKKNSLFGTDVEQQQDTVENFQEKIRAGKRAQVTEDFMVIARIESLILKAGVDDAIRRAQAYIEAGADGIMIHSKEKMPDEVLEFCRRYKQLDRVVPLVAVPSSYSKITEDELIDAGVKIVIYANHLIRSAYPSMVKTAESILKHNRCFEASEEIMPIKEILTLIPGGK